MLGAGVEPVDLHVGCVGDQSDLTYVVGFGEACPCLDGVLGCLVAGVREVQVALGLVVRHRAFGFSGA
jgi:hypothetical protein